jgi:hypothetical protein
MSLDELDNAFRGSPAGPIPVWKADGLAVLAAGPS